MERVLDGSLSGFHALSHWRRGVSNADGVGSSLSCCAHPGYPLTSIEVLPVLKDGDCWDIQTTQRFLPTASFIASLRALWPYPNTSKRYRCLCWAGIQHLPVSCALLSLFSYRLAEVYPGLTSRSLLSCSFSWLLYRRCCSWLFQLQQAQRQDILRCVCVCILRVPARDTLKLSLCLSVLRAYKAARAT
jgi:hypothetical protein